MLVCVDTLAPGSRRAGRTACIARTRQLTDSPSTPINATCQHAARQRARSPCAQLSPIAGCSTAHTVCANAASIAAASCSVKTTNGDPSQSRSDRSPAGSSLVRAASTGQAQEESPPRPQSEQEEERSRRRATRARTGGARTSTGAGTRPGARPQSGAAAAPPSRSRAGRSRRRPCLPDSAAATRSRPGSAAARTTSRRQSRGQSRSAAASTAYALAYDDGATETGVAASFIRRVGGASTPATQSAPNTTPAPELDGLVAYSKGGAPAPAAPRTSHAASLTAKPRPRAPMMMMTTTTRSKSSRASTTGRRRLPSRGGRPSHARHRGAQSTTSGEE